MYYDVLLPLFAPAPQMFSFHATKSVHRSHQYILFPIYSSLKSYVISALNWEARTGIPHDFPTTHMCGLKISISDVNLEAPIDLRISWHCSSTQQSLIQCLCWIKEKVTFPIPGQPNMQKDTYSCTVWKHTMEGNKT